MAADPAEDLRADAINTDEDLRASAELQQAISNARMQRVALILTIAAIANRAGEPRSESLSPRLGRQKDVDTPVLTQTQLPPGVGVGVGVEGDI